MQQTVDQSCLRDRQDDDKNDKMCKKYATNRQKVCTRGKIPTHAYKGREMNALFMRCVGHSFS